MSLGALWPGSHPFYARMSTRVENVRANLDRPDVVDTRQTGLKFKRFIELLTVIENSTIENETPGFDFIRGDASPNSGTYYGHLHNYLNLPWLRNVTPLLKLVMGTELFRHFKDWLQKFVDERPRVAQIFKDLLTVVQELDSVPNIDEKVRQTLIMFPFLNNNPYWSDTMASSKARGAHSPVYQPLVETNATSETGISNTTLLVGLTNSVNKLTTYIEELRARILSLEQRNQESERILSARIQELITRNLESEQRNRESQQSLLAQIQQLIASHASLDQRNQGSRRTSSARVRELTACIATLEQNIKELQQIISNLMHQRNNRVQHGLDDVIAASSNQVQNEPEIVINEPPALIRCNMP